MPELKWSQLEFIECLETVPEVGEYGTAITFQVGQDRLDLRVTVEPYDCEVTLALYEHGTTATVMEFCLIVRGAVEHKKFKGTEYLEFQNCVIGPVPFIHSLGRPFDREEWPRGLDVQLAIKPHIRVSIDHSRYSPWVIE